MKLAILLGMIASANAADPPFSWPLIGGSPYRTNFALLNQFNNLNNQRDHLVYEFDSNIEGTEFAVEDYLLQSPLVSANGNIIIASDDCNLYALPDPASLASGSMWAPLYQASPPSNEIGYEMAGIALQDDFVFLLNSRGKALHIFKDTGSSFQEQPYSPVHLGLNFEIEASLLPDPSTNTIFIPNRFSLMDHVNVSARVNWLTGAVTMTTKDAADPLCNQPDDLGNALCDNQGSACLMSSPQCGLQKIDTNGSIVTLTEPNEFGFSYEAHSHPLFDTAKSQFYFLNWGTEAAADQELCCFDSSAGENGCDDWRHECVVIPRLSHDDDDNSRFLRWEWLALGLNAANNVIYVVASSPANDAISGVSPSELTSSLYAYRTTDGRRLASYTFTGDMFNSQPLVVTDSAGNTMIYISSTLGNLYCFSSTSIAGGPLWSVNHFPSIPLSELPETTYSFLSVTAAGTILLTSTEGGENWNVEKSNFAIVNGIFQPPPPPSPGMTAASAAILSIFLIIFTIIGLVVLYQRVPAFHNLVQPMVEWVQDKLLVFQGYKAVAPPALNQASGYGSASEKSSLTGGKVGGSKGYSDF